MKLKIKNNKLRILAATSVTIFSLAVAFTGAFAWFSINKAVNSNGADNTVQNVTGRLKQITFHQLSQKHTSNGVTTGFSFYKNEVGKITYNWSSYSASYSGNTSIALSKYTPLDQEHPLLMLFEFNDDYDCSEDPMYIKATSRCIDFLGGRDKNTHKPIHSLNDVYKVIDDVPYYGLSSVAYFYTKPFSSTDFSTSFNGTSTYDFTKTSLTVGGRFTTVNNDTEDSSFTKDITIANETNGTVKYIAIILDYYIDAVEFIYSTFLGDDILETAYDYYLHFICDWSMEVY